MSDAFLRANEVIEEAQVAAQHDLEKAKALVSEAVSDALSEEKDDLAVELLNRIDPSKLPLSVTTDVLVLLSVLRTPASVQEAGRALLGRLVHTQKYCA